MLPGAVMKKLTIIFSWIVMATIYINATETSNLHRYIWANYNQFGNKPQVAQHWYSELIGSHAPLYSYKGYINFLYSTGKFKTIVTLIPSLEEAFKDDPDTQLMFARSFERLGLIKQADEKIIRLNNHFKTHQEIAFQAAQSYVRRKEPENAIKAIDDLLNNSPRKPNNFIFYFFKAQIQHSLDFKEDALKSIKIALDMHRNFDKGWLFYALLEEELGQLDQAMKGFTTFLELTGSNQEIEQHLMQLAFKQKILQKKNPAISSSKSCFEKALFLFDQQEFSKALKQVNMCLQDNPDDKESTLLKVEILASSRDYAQAANLIKERLLKDPENQLWYRTLHLLCQAGLSHQKAIAILEDVCHQQPTRVLPLLYLADLHLRTHTIETSLIYQKKALEHSHEPMVKTKILFQMALIYYQTQQFDAMENVLKQGLALNTQFPPLLNLLAYHYASTGKELAQAQQLMDTVLQYSKKNPYYLDTQAVIFYQQKQYDKARDLLQYVTQKIPSNGCAHKHLAQAYYQLGDKTQAVSSLQQALNVASVDHEKNEFTQLLKQWNRAP